MQRVQPRCQPRLGQIQSDKRLVPLTHANRFDSSQHPPYLIKDIDSCEQADDHHRHPEYFEVRLPGPHTIGTCHHKQQQPLRMFNSQPQSLRASGQQRHCASGQQHIRLATPVKPAKYVQWQHKQTCTCCHRATTDVSRIQSHS